jgi:iron(III) transport system permease protein
VVRVLPPSPYGFWGAYVALTLFTFPYVLLTVQAALRGIDPSLEEASRSLGHGPLATFLRVTVPQLRVSAAAGGLLVTLYVLSDFGAVSILRYSTFTRALYLQYRSAFDRAPAAVLGLLLVASRSSSWSWRRGRRVTAGASSARPARPARRRRSRSARGGGRRSACAASSCCSAWSRRSP